MGLARAGLTLVSWNSSGGLAAQKWRPRSGDEGAARVERDKVMSVLIQFTQALVFAADRHADQRRKGEAQEPYINHLAEVALLTAEATGGRDTSLVIAALLHDAIEDTDTTFEELSAEFGSDVAMLVQEVTDDKSLPWAERKRLQVETAPNKSHRAKVIKLADKISNLRSIAQSPPREWTPERRAGYVDWAENVAKGLIGGNSFLEQEFKTAAADARAAIEGDAAVVR